MIKAVKSLIFFAQPSGFVNSITLLLPFVHYSVLLLSLFLFLFLLFIYIYIHTQTHNQSINLTQTQSYIYHSFLLFHCIFFSCFSSSEKEGKRRKRKRKKKYILFTKRCLSLSFFFVLLNSESQHQMGVVCVMGGKMVFSGVSL